VNFDFTISVSHIITIMGFAAAFAWNWFTLKSKTDRAFEKAQDAEEETRKTQDMLVALDKRVSQQELQMLKEYASLSHIQSIETRLTSQMQQMNEELRELNKFLRSGK
jgi:uncharacterized protein with von Willebrand factor type A (vWA) domain